MEHVHSSSKALSLQEAVVTLSIKKRGAGWQSNGLPFRKKTLLV